VQINMHNCWPSPRCSFFVHVSWDAPVHTYVIFFNYYKQRSVHSYPYAQQILLEAHHGTVASFLYQFSTSHCVLGQYIAPHEISCLYRCYLIGQFFNYLRWVSASTNHSIGLLWPDQSSQALDVLLFLIYLHLQVTNHLLLTRMAYENILYLLMWQYQYKVAFISSQHVRNLAYLYSYATEAVVIRFIKTLG
jgi:hypothetical protein